MITVIPCKITCILARAFDASTARCSNSTSLSTAACETRSHKIITEKTTMREQTVTNNKLPSLWHYVQCAPLQPYALWWLVPLARPRCETVLLEVICLHKHMKAVPETI
jgi:hypothetical protein